MVRKLCPKCVRKLHPVSRQDAENRALEFLEKAIMLFEKIDHFPLAEPSLSIEDRAALVTREEKAPVKILAKPFTK